MFVLNIPNVLTLVRVILVPVFIALYCCGQTGLAFAAYVAASLTDAVDGRLARRLNQVTDFGKLMDPLADKLMQMSMMFCLAGTGYLPWWVLFVLLAKEAVMVAGGALLLKRDVVVMSNWSGKAARCCSCWRSWRFSPGTGSRPCGRPGACCSILARR